MSTRRNLLFAGAFNAWLTEDELRMVRIYKNMPDYTAYELVASALIRQRMFSRTRHASRRFRYRRIARDIHLVDALTQSAQEVIPLETG